MPRGAISSASDGITCGVHRAGGRGGVVHLDHQAEVVATQPSVHGAAALDIEGEAEVGVQAQ